MFLFGMNVWRNGARFQGCKISAFYPYIPPKRPSKGGGTRKNHFFVEAAVDYAFSAGLDEVSIMTKDQTLKPVLEKLGFISLGIDGDVASYTLGLEDKEKGKIRI